MKNKTYVVTGAASGIGKALCGALTPDNIIFAGCRSVNNFEGENIYPFYIDYSKPETIPPAVEFIKSKCRKIDTLINAAGCVAAGPAEKISLNEIRRQFDVNVFGPLEFSRSLLDYLEGGKIINISSMSSYGIFPFISPYCASKKCLDMFFNSLLIETKHNIKVVSIKPGVIATPLWEKSVKENSKYLENYTGFEKEIEFIIENARKNGKCGLAPECAAEVILRADSLENPKLSYTVGTDAALAHWFSKLPQGIVNKFVKFGLQSRINKMTVK